MKNELTLALFLALTCHLPAQIEVTSGGAVGVGTASPGTKLDVQGDGNDSQDIFRVTRGGGNLARLQFGHNYIQRFNGDGSYGNILLNINGGNVGIGTTSPLSKLHVMGVGRFGYNDGGNNNIGGLLIASGTGAGGARQYWIGASNPTSHNNNMFVISDYNGSTNSPLLTIYGTHAGSAAGYVGIGTTTPAYKLDVAGSVRATSFISDTTTYADFVFKPGYKLASLSETEATIQREGHLPGIPSEAEAREHGVDLSAMQVKLLQKVEELTLHLIAHEKQLAQLQQENAGLRRELAGLKNR